MEKDGKYEHSENNYGDLTLPDALVTLSKLAVERDSNVQ
jgi:hypothetical protein